VCGGPRYHTFRSAQPRTWKGDCRESGMIGPALAVELAGQVPISTPRRSAR
jgi:hypothetical protein